MNELDKILEEIDKIEDDAEFCEAEHDAVLDYCQEHNFNMTDDEMAIIKSRGLYDSYEVWLEIHDESSKWE